jgi:ABC-2 type transport system permease protein
MKTVIHFIKKEFQQFKRDPKMFAMVLIAPILQSIILGYAANLDINNINLIVFNQDQSKLSRDYVDKFTHSGYFTITKDVNSYDEMTKDIAASKALIGIVIPRDFEKDIRNNRTSHVQILVDGSDGNKGSIAFGYTQGVTSNFSQQIILESAARRGIKTSTGTITPEVRIWYNPELKTRNFMVPSITALILLLTTTLLTSLAVVKEKELGTLEQLIVTPIKPWQMVLGKLIPFVILGFATMALVNSIMIFWFGIPIRGSIIFYLFSSFLYILSTLGLGLFISTISKTQQQAMMVSIFGAMMPMIYLSGFAFPIENMPKIIQYITYAIPMRYFITIIRGVILKGIGFADLWREALMLFFMGITILFLSSLRFKKRLE